MVLRVVTFKLQEELLQKIDDAVKNGGFGSRSDLIREALEQYLKGLNGQADERSKEKYSKGFTPGPSINDEED